MKKWLGLFVGSALLLSLICFGCDSSSGGGSGCGSSTGECADMDVYNWRGEGAPPSGPYRVVIEQDPNFNTRTLYHPQNVPFKMPIIVWANGGCMLDGLMFDEFLAEIASHGFLIVADGRPNGSGMRSESLNYPDGTPLIEALDYAFDQNALECSPFYQKLDTDHVAAMGQSCGGLMTYGASADPRLTTVVIWNSGLFERIQEIYNGLHAPMAFFIGGRNDVAYPNAAADFAVIDSVPVFYANLDVGHMGTYGQDNGGEFGRVAVAWLKYQLLEDQGPAGAQMFEGANCGLCRTDWVIQKTNMP